MSIFKTTNTKVNSTRSLGLSKKLASVIMCVGFVGGVIGVSEASFGYDSTKGVTASGVFKENLPIIPKYPSYNPGGFDCRSLIGTSSAQTYSLFRYGKTPTQRQDGSTMQETTGVTITQLPRYSTQVMVSDPDHDYKTCLLYQMVWRGVHAENPSDQLNYTENVPTGGVPDKDPLNISNALDSLAADNKQNTIDKIFYKASRYDALAMVKNNYPWDALGGAGFIKAGTQNDFDIPMSYHFASSEKVDGLLRIAPGSQPVPYNGSLLFSYFSTISNLTQTSLYKNEHLGLLLAKHPWGRHNSQPWLAIQDWLGYTPNVSLFNTSLDVGALFKDGGYPKFGDNGSLSVGCFSSSCQKGVNDNIGDGNDKGLETTTTNIKITLDSGVFSKAVTSGEAILQGGTKGGTTVAKSSDSLDVTNWKKGKKPFWGKFVSDVLNKAIAQSTNAMKNVVGYVDGSGYYHGDSRGMLVNTSGTQMWNQNLNQHRAFLSSLAMFFGSKTTSCTSGYVTSGTHTDSGVKGCYTLRQQTDASGHTNQDSRIGWEMIPASTHLSVKLGVPLCGSPMEAPSGTLNYMKYSTGVDKDGNPLPANKQLSTSGLISGYPVGRLPAQPFGTNSCTYLYKAWACDNKRHATMGSDTCKTFLKTYKGPSSINNPWFSGMANAPNQEVGKIPNSEAPDNSGPYTFIEPQSIFGVCAPDDPNCSAKLPSWWNIGQSYLIVNKLLAQNVQRLVDNINIILGDGGSKDDGTKIPGYHLKEALDAFSAPFNSSTGAVSITVSQKLKFDVGFSGGMNGTLHLTYVPASKANGTANSLSKSNESLSSPLTRNYLILAVENKDFTASADRAPGLDSVSSGIQADPGLINEIKGLPDSLARPLEYYAMYYRVINSKTGDYTKALSDSDYNTFNQQITGMMDTLALNGLVSTDMKGGNDNTEFMYSSINSALSSIYTHITPSQVNGAGSISYINPEKIEGDLQQIYEFGDSSGAPGDGAKKMIGKQYDFLTQIQQLGVHMVGDVVDNIYQIGDAYTNTFNANSALINGNLTQSLKGTDAIQAYAAKSVLDAQRNQAPSPDSVKNNLANKYQGHIKQIADRNQYEAPLNAAAGIATEAYVNAKVLGEGTTVNLGPAATIASSLNNAGINRLQAEAQEYVGGVQIQYNDKQLQLANSGIKINNMMLAVQHKQLELSQMSYQMMVNMTKSMMLLPLAFVVLTMLFTAGIQFALIIPMTPYIIFWAGQTSWLINAIEAMVAAPLVGLALLHPGGHAYYGHSIQAYKMLINVILKPVLLVFGTIASMVLIYIIVVYSAQGFHMMGNSIVGSFLTFNYGTNPDGTYQNFDRVTNVRAILSLMLIFMYATFLTMVFNKCFSVIYLLPEKVVSWVGGQSDNFGKEASQHLAQATKQEAGQVAQAGQQSTQSIAGGSKEMTSSKGQAASSQEGTGVQMAGTSEKNVSAESQVQSNESTGVSQQGNISKSQGESDAAYSQKL